MKVPSLLRPLHGSTTTPGELLLVYLTGIAFASLVLLSIQDRSTELAPLQVAILVLVSIDLGGGAVANLCQGTRSYWRSKTLRLRMLFLSVHAIHAIGISYVFPEVAASAAVAYLWMLATGSILMFTGNTSVPLALSLALVGAAVVQQFQGLGAAPSFLLTAFLVKLVFSFSGGPRKLHE